MTVITGNIVDIHQQQVYPGQVLVEGERIQSIERTGNPGGQPLPYILPGFIDAHVHIESSLLIPAEFARLAVVHGTVATVSDPHEIANVCGMEGVNFMIENGKTVPFKFNFGAPSCVPATRFETAGAVLDAQQIDALLKRDEILYLSEMMNFPGVLEGEKEVMQKIASAHQYNKPVDGHAPGLRGEAVRKYIAAGISTDHECFTREEAVEKLSHGMKILIREGSAAKNFEALADLLQEHADMMMFCSDDKHPDSLVDGHINQLCARAVARGIDLFKVLKAACANPVHHYKLKVGLLRKNDFADFILVRDLKDFEVLQTYINGRLVAEKGKSLIRIPPSVRTASPVNQFRTGRKKTTDFGFPSPATPIPVIEALDGQLVTGKIMVEPAEVGGMLVSDPNRDILKIAVVNRYREAPVALGFIKNFGLKKGAIASSVAHDSHNIVAVGVDDESLCKAVNLIIESKGGISCTSGDQESILPLPVAGLMSQEDGYDIAAKYSAMDRMAREAGSTLSSPFMTLSFMALLVIPHLKLGDKGLFDVDAFDFV